MAQCTSISRGSQKKSSPSPRLDVGAQKHRLPWLHETWYQQRNWTQVGGSLIVSGRILPTGMSSLPLSDVGLPALIGVAPSIKLTSVSTVSTSSRWNMRPPGTAMRLIAYGRCTLKTDPSFEFMYTAVGRSTQRQGPIQEPVFEPPVDDCANGLNVVQTAPSTGES